MRLTSACLVSFFKIQIFILMKYSGEGSSAGQAESMALMDMMNDRSGQGGWLAGVAGNGL